MIIVQGWVDIDPDDLPLFRAHARTLAKAARRAPGNLAYAFGEDLNDAGLVHLVAHWADEHAVAGHLLSDEIAAFMAHGSRNFVTCGFASRALTGRAKPC